MLPLSRMNWGGRDASFPVHGRPMESGEAARKAGCASGLSNINCTESKLADPAALAGRRVIGSASDMTRSAEATRS